MGCWAMEGVSPFGIAGERQSVTDDNARQKDVGKPSHRFETDSKPNCLGANECEGKPCRVGGLKDRLKSRDINCSGS